MTDKADLHGLKGDRLEANVKSEDVGELNDEYNDMFGDRNVEESSENRVYENMLDDVFDEYDSYDEYSDYVEVDVNNVEESVVGIEEVNQRDNVERHKKFCE